ncbi:MAG: DUF3006 domain-containing protein [Caryophanon sp.]|nr:DUF3006 domain-containing protein [Caryophanon sp.]
MQSIKYVLDRYENDYGIFLKLPNETEQLLVHKTEMIGEAHEGDICIVQQQEGKFQIDVLTDDTAHAKATAQSLLDKLKQKGKR